VGSDSGTQWSITSSRSTVPGTESGGKGDSNVSVIAQMGKR